MTATAVATLASDHICYPCKRRFTAADLLKRHERTSALHKQTMAAQDSTWLERKDNLRAAIQAMRHHIVEADATLGEQTSPNENLQNQRTILEMQLRQLLGEYALIQGLLEDIRDAKEAKRRGGAGPTRALEVTVAGIALSAGAASWMGNKDVQEDRDIVRIALKARDGTPIAGFAVLDGHSGSLCVECLVDRLPHNLQKCIAAKSVLTEESLRQAVAEACLITDDEFLVKARSHEVLDGSTMILALVFPEKGRPRMLIANVGDSRAVLCRSGSTSVLSGGDGQEQQQLTAVRLSDDHKPNRPDEQRRIEAKGGIVDMQGAWRVFTPGSTVFGGRHIQKWGLAVSRAFGDLLLKEPEKYGCTGVLPGGLISAVPEIQVLDINPIEDRFLVLACDGVWDVLSDDDAVAVCAGQGSSEAAALHLVRRSFSAGSDDNLTALVVTWKPAR